ncbi:MAG: hypothetical protein JJU25_10320 [Halomonas sp.]|nr:hypothetical protein [Halomonas sp.]MCC5883016.1 hypothetical protein [Halomonas sp.]
MRRKVTLTFWRWPLALLALSGLAHGQEPAEMVGNMTGVLDGQEKEWFILSQGADSNATFTVAGDRTVIDLVGFIEPDSWRVRDSLSLSITLIEGEVVDFDLLHPIGASAMPPVFTSDEADVSLVLDTFEVTGGKAHVAGRVEGTLALQQALGEEATLEEGIRIAVEFDAEASRIEY